jgi:alkanesulfonate monooxygenase SsuD/methylene tetrahydromethanopterin reductase-like flavin-dependent oxidoreductase (luciferase family)
LPIPQPPPPIYIAGQTPTGARLAARLGDGWTLDVDGWERLLPVYLAELDAAGRRRTDQRIYVSDEGADWLADFDLAETAWVREPRAAWERWREAGADGAVLLARTTADVDALVGAVDRW